MYNKIQEVLVFKTEETRFPSPNDTVFTFRKDKKHHWLQKICFSILTKLGCSKIDYISSYERHLINNDSIVQYLFEHECELFEFYNLQGSRLLIGPEEYANITGNPEVRRMLNFRVNYYNNLTYMDMKITVVPWMKGMLIVPDNVFDNKGSV